MALEKTGVTQLMEFDEYITANQLNILTKSISFKGSHSISSLVLKRVLDDEYQ